MVKAQNRALAGLVTEDLPSVAADVKTISQRGADLAGTRGDEEHAESTGP
jgi:hypothetical protein